MSEPEMGAGGAQPLRVPCLSNPQHEELAVHLKDRDFVWVDLISPEPDELKRLAELIGLHPLTVEDAHTFKQRPKLEEYEGYVFLVVFGVDAGTQSGGPLLREMHIIISGDYVVTIHRTRFEALEAVRTRYDRQPVRSEQFLVYKILDAVTSTFVPVLSRIDDDIDDLEQEVIDNPTTELLQQIFSLKRDLVAMRRVVSPMRDLFARDADTITALPGLGTDDRLYYRDLYDSLVRVAELVDSYRDLLSGATDMYLSTVANRQGEINKQLTVIATIFLPLTFLTGFFGQNFAFLTNHITETTWSFLVFGIGLLVASVVGFAVYFRRKRWV
ncbi:MAG TPA: magnesium/cobalt transporter CorA [Solirubrobacteraceae bacterium]|nr:magnesium/cobalt transporter CorA [Solirubrobacteraceae bacterium]